MIVKKSKKAMFGAMDIGVTGLALSGIPGSSGVQSAFGKASKMYSPYLSAAYASDIMDVLKPKK